jgi:hypothetical protein
MSHFLEFIPENNNEPVLIDQLTPQTRYTVVITTGGGLYRYRLGDIIEVVDIRCGMPIISFEGRDQICDQVGEKLHEKEVTYALREARKIIRKDVAFAMAAPERFTR